MDHGTTDGTSDSFYITPAAGAMCVQLPRDHHSDHAWQLPVITPG
jgi:hypothetical protein